MLAVVGGLSCAGLSALMGYTFTMDGGGIYAHNPQAEAQATRTALQAQAEAAKLEQERITQERARPAMVTALTIAYIGGGLGILIISVGLALAFTAWVNKRASSVYPNAAGLYPVITRQTANGMIIHDPNRAVGATSIYTTPSVTGALVERAGLALPGVAVNAPLSASEGVHAQITSQAQAVSLMTAATHKSNGRTEDTQKLVQSVVSGAGSGAGRMPTITVIDDPARIANFEQKLLLESEGE